MKKGERASSALFHSLHKWDSLPKCGKVGPFFADFVLHGLIGGKKGLEVWMEIEYDFKVRYSFEELPLANP